MKTQVSPEVSLAAPRAEEKEEVEDEDEVTHFSEGQLIPSVSGLSAAHSYSDDSEISEDIIEEGM